MIWKMPVTWEMCACINVKADTLDEAIELARDAAGVIPLPKRRGTYIDGSWDLASDDEEYLLSLQTAKVVATHKKQKRSADNDR